MRDGRQQYKRDYDNLVRVTPTLSPGDLVLAERPFLAAAATHSANALANLTCKKLLARAFTPLHVISVQPHTLTNDEDDIPNTISIDQAACTPPRACQRTASGDLKIQKCDRDKHISEHAHPLGTSTTDDTSQEYNVQRTVRRVNSERNIW